MRSFLVSLAVLSLSISAVAETDPVTDDYYVCWSKPYNVGYQGPWFYGWGQTEELAKADAIGFCEKRTKGDCYASCRKQKS